MNHRFKKKKKNHFSFFAYIFLSAGQDYGKNVEKPFLAKKAKTSKVKKHLKKRSCKRFSDTFLA